MTLDWALRYGRQGVRLVPCHGKAAAITDWPNRATGDPEQLRAWWREWPDANIGVVGGHGHLALDVDGDEGRESLRALEADLGVLPTTKVVASGRDGYGRHYWFRCPPGNTFWTPGPGLEVRALGQLTLVPPSIHPDTGRAYVWLDERPSAPAPPWMLARPGHTPAMTNAEAPAILVPVGMRYVALVKMLGLLRSTGRSAAFLVASTHNFLDTEVEIDEARRPLDRGRAVRAALDIAKRYPPRPNHIRPGSNPFEQ
jgi:hypothetical protein